MKYILILVLLWPSSVFADERRVANIISYGTVATQIVLNTVHNWKQPDRKKAITIEVVKIVFTIAASETVKHYVHEDRPDHSDNLSFWSEHSALACGNGSYNMAAGISLSAATMIGRIVAKKHNWWDTAAGCGAGVLIDKAVR